MSENPRSNLEDNPQASRSEGEWVIPLNPELKKKVDRSAEVERNRKASRELNPVKNGSLGVDGKKKEDHGEEILLEQIQNTAAYYESIGKINIAQRLLKSYQDLSTSHDPKKAGSEFRQAIADADKAQEAQPAKAEPASDATKVEGELERQSRAELAQLVRKMSRSGSRELKHSGEMSIDKRLMKGAKEGPENSAEVEQQIKLTRAEMQREIDEREYGEYLENPRKFAKAHGFPTEAITRRPLEEVDFVSTCNELTSNNGINDPDQIYGMLAAGIKPYDKIEYVEDKHSGRGDDRYRMPGSKKWISKEERSTLLKKYADDFVKSISDRASVKSESAQEAQLTKAEPALVATEAKLVTTPEAPAPVESQAQTTVVEPQLVSESEKKEEPTKVVEPVGQPIEANPASVAIEAQPVTQPEAPAPAEPQAQAVNPEPKAVAESEKKEVQPVGKTEEEKPISELAEARIAYMEAVDALSSRLATDLEYIKLVKTCEGKRAGVSESPGGEGPNKKSKAWKKYETSDKAREAYIKKLKEYEDAEEARKKYEAIEQAERVKAEPAQTAEPVPIQATTEAQPVTTPEALEPVGQQTVSERSDDGTAWMRAEEAKAPIEIIEKGDDGTGWMRGEAVLKTENVDTKKEAERALFSERQREVVEKIANKRVESGESGKEEYLDVVELEPGLKKGISGVIASDIEDIYREFALDWCRKPENLRKMEEKGKAIPTEASDELKANMVLSFAVEDLQTQDYQAYRKKIEQAETLLADLKHDQLLPETIYLTLNYLQKGFIRESAVLGVRERMANEGNKSAKAEAESKRKEVENLDSLRKAVMGIIIGRNPEEQARENLNKEWVRESHMTKDEWVEKEWSGKESEERRVEEMFRLSLELAGKELQAYDRLPEKEKAKYRNRLNLGDIKIDVPREEFVASIAGKGYLPAQIEALYQKERVNTFREAISKLADRNGIRGVAVWGLLDQGCKPHEPIKWSFWGDGILMPKGNGATQEIKPPKSEGGNIFAKLLNRQSAISQEYVKFVEEAGIKFQERINTTVIGELRTEWDSLYKELLNEEIEKDIREKAFSLESFEDGVDGFYEKSKQRVVQEYIEARETEERKRAEKTELEELKEAKETAEGEVVRLKGENEQLKREAVEAKRAKETSEAEKERGKDISDIPEGILNKVLEEITYPESRLFEFGSSTDRNDNNILRDFFRYLRVRVDDRVIQSVSPAERNLARQGGKAGLLKFIISIIKKSIKQEV